MGKDDKSSVGKRPVSRGVPQFYGGGPPVGWLQDKDLSAELIGKPFTVEADGSIVPLCGEMVMCTAAEPVEGENCTFFADTMNLFYRQCIGTPLHPDIKPSFIYVMSNKWSSDIGVAGIERFAKPAAGKLRATRVLKTFRNHKLSAAPIMPAAENIGAVAGEHLLNMAQKRSEAPDEEGVLRRKALELLGLAETIIPIGTTEQLIEAIASGFPSSVLEALRRAGWTYELMDKVIVPRRTLMRRKATGQTLTPSESDAAWRLAFALAAASVVFASREAALEWLTRPKSVLRERSPAELLQSSVGADHVLAILRRIDRGDFV